MSIAEPGIDESDVVEHGVAALGLMAAYWMATLPVLGGALSALACGVFNRPLICGAFAGLSPFFAALILGGIDLASAAVWEMLSWLPRLGLAWWLWEHAIGRLDALPDTQ